jgi:flagellar biosynthetic protein FliR
MGFGSAGLIGPQNQASVSVLVPLYGWLALMVFFFADMHHNVIKLFVLSFQATRGFQDGVLSNTAVLAQIALLAGKLFVLAVQMAAPFTALVLVVNVALGVLGRTMPQMNIMLFSFPLTMIFGFCAMYLVAPDLLDYMVQVMGDLSGECLNLLRSL